MDAHATPADRLRTPAILEPLLTVAELAEYLGVPVATIYDWRVNGKGPRGIRIGRSVKFAVSDVRSWLDAHREAGSAAAPGGR